MDKVYPDMLSLLLFRSLYALSASKGTFDDGLVIFGGLKRKNQRERESGSSMINFYSVESKI